MLDRPDAAELMEALAAFLDEEVVPAFEGGRRFHALVAANVSRIVAREMRDGERLAAEAVSELEALLEHAGSGITRDGEPGGDGRTTLYELSMELCEKIERGEFDSEHERAVLMTFLKRWVRRRLEIDNPKLVS